MRIKKLFASVLAGAMALCYLVMPVGAAVELDGTGDNTDLFYSTDTTIDLTTADTIVVHAYCSDTNYGWNNGSFVVQTTTSWAWIQKQFGGYECENYPSWFPEGSVVIEEEGGFDVTISLEGYVGEGFKFIYSIEASDAFSIESVDIYAGSTLLATWADYEWTYPDVLTIELTDDQLAAVEYTVTLENSDGATATITDSTYVSDASGNYIEIDLSDIPDSQTVTVQDVDFTY